MPRMCSINVSTPELSARSVEADASLPRHGCLDLGSLWDDAGLHISPERDEKAACQRDDGDAAHPALGLADTLAEPAAQGAARLVAQPQPGQLYHRGSEAPVAGLGDPLFTVDAAALPRHRRQAGISRHLAPVAEAAEECLQLQHRRDLRANALESRQQADLAGARARYLDRRVPLRLDLRELGQHELEALQFAQDLLLQARR